VAERDDQRLIAAYRRGDDKAFDAIYDRYRPMLLRYARRVLGANGEHAEDVVQEGMWRAARALRRDERHIELKPWLFRLVRNTALDELARVRTDSVDLDTVDAAGALRAPDHSQPEQAHERRTSIREVLGDIAALSEQQRHALIRREVDGLSHAQLAVELGLTEQASKNLVFRARTNLVKHRDARTYSHEEVQRDLLTAHDEQRRASAATYRHLATCKECRDFRAALRGSRKAMALLSPGPLLLAGGLAFFGVKAASATAKGTLVKAGATATAGVATVGAVGVIGVQVFAAGDPAPQQVDSRAVPGGTVQTGQPLPRGTAVVRGTVELRPGGARTQAVALPCPTGLHTADLLPSAGAPVTATYAPGSTVGADTVGRLVVTPRDEITRATRVRVGILCKRPDREGSIVADDPGRVRAARSGDALTIRVRSGYLHTSPDGPVAGSVRFGQPVRQIGEPRGDWTRIVTDTGERGWVRSEALRLR
jgi:RNA polymerase sigma factor (sigma-70 family)